MKEYCYRLGSGLAFSEQRDLSMMEKMAAEGYHLVGSTFFFFKFKKGKPETVTYSLDLAQPEDLEEYKNIFAAGGWQHVLSLGYLHFFKAPKGTTPIYTERDGEIQKHTAMATTSLQMALWSSLIAIVAFILAAFVPTLRLWIGALGGAALGVAVTMFFGFFLNRRRSHGS